MGFNSEDCQKFKTSSFRKKKFFSFLNHSCNHFLASLATTTGHHFYCHHHWVLHSSPVATAPSSSSQVVATIELSYSSNLLQRFLAQVAAAICSSFDAFSCLKSSWFAYLATTKSYSNLPPPPRKPPMASHSSGSKRQPLEDRWQQCRLLQQQNCCTLAANPYFFIKLRDQQLLQIINKDSGLIPSHKKKKT